MKKISLIFAIFILITVFSSSDALGTEFELTLKIKNNSGEWLKYVLKKGRILELARIESSYYQSIIITEGEGLILVPPYETVERKIKGTCLHKGMSFPEIGEEIHFTPFIGSEELISAGNDQTKVHQISSKPLASRVKVIAKGYSDKKKNGLKEDKDEAFLAAVFDAASQCGIDFQSKSISSQLKMLEYKNTVTITEKTIKFLKVIHEEYDEKEGKYFFIGEFEVKFPPSAPQVNH